MTPISQKVADRALELRYQDDPVTLHEAIQAVLDKTETWRKNAVGAVFADEVLLALADPLGLNVAVCAWGQAPGGWTQLEDLDEKKD